MKKKRPPHPPKKKLRSQVYYSEAFRRQRVLDIEQGLISVTEVHRIYGVSISTVYDWLHRYSTTCTHQHRQVIELESEEHKTLALLERVAELERVIGQKQLHIDILEHVLKQAEAQLGPEWKKKHSGQPSSSSSKAASTDTK